MLETIDLCKSFGPVPVLKRVSLQLRAGCILGLIGENGAGKSTFINCLSGALVPDSGEIRLDGRPRRFPDRASALAAGIVTVPQEFNLIGPLRVWENIFLGAEPRRFGLLDRAAMKRRSRELLARLHCDLDVDRRIEELGVAEKQFVEIARALNRDCRVLILDEPTTVLNAPETERLFGIMRELKAAGAALLFVSHKLREVAAVCDEVAVLRDGVLTDRVPAAETDPAAMARMMVGRELARPFPETAPVPPDAPVRLKVSHLTVPGLLNDVSLELRAGEILGVAGLGGSGRSELLESLYGLHRAAAGQIEVDGTPVALRRPADAVRAGLSLLPEDRQGAGLLADFSIARNTALVPTAHSRFLLDLKREAEQAAFYIRRLAIRCRGGHDRVGSLSGGNQQKVSVAKGLATGPKVFLFDEPTRGVDIGAREEIYRFIAELAQQGLGVLMVSSDLEEIIGLCRRVLVMRGGAAAGELSGADITEENIMYLATGIGA